MTRQYAAGMDASERAARLDLVTILRAAVLHGFHEGIDNHISLAVPGSDDRFLLNPYGPHWSELRASDLLVVDGAGRVEGPGEAELTAFWLHSRLHRARPDAACVIHTHMPYATALALTTDGLDTRLSQNAVRYHGRLAFHEEYSGRIVDEGEGDRLAKAVSDGVRVVLLANHGVLVVGESAAAAWYDLYFLERACLHQVLAASTGQILRRMPEDVAELAAEQFEEERTNHSPLLFAAERRRLDRELPGYDG